MVDGLERPASARWSAKAPRSPSPSTRVSCQSTSPLRAKALPICRPQSSFSTEAVDSSQSGQLPLDTIRPGEPKAFETGVSQDERAANCRGAPATNASKQALMSYAWWSSPEGEAAGERGLRLMQK